jgi:hypothetical protein
MLRKLVAMPMTEFERQSVDHIKLPRASLAPGETWRPYGWVNNRYAVQWSDVETPDGMIAHLWIRQHDRRMPRSWRDLQTIKNELCGPERVGVEVFPAVSQLVDFANMAHLWVYPEGFALPFRLWP